MERKRVKWFILTMLWSASWIIEASAGKAAECAQPKAEKGDCRGTKIKFTWHAQQDRSVRGLLLLGTCKGTW